MYLPRFLKSECRRHDYLLSYKHDVELLFQPITVVDRQEAPFNGIISKVQDGFNSIFDVL